MHHLTLLAPVVGVASLVQAAVIDKRTTYPGTCSAASGLITSSGQSSEVNTYCAAYLGILTRTITATITSTKGTVFATGTAYTTTTNTNTPVTSTISRSTTSTATATTTPNGVTSTATATSTAFLDNDGNTIALQRRGLETQAPNKRAVYAVPAVFSGWARPSITSACACLNLPTPTLTRTKTLIATATSAATLQRTIATTTTVAVPLLSTTSTHLATQTLVAPAPITTATAVDIEQVKGCPTGTTSTFLCPDGTAVDDGTLTVNGELNCGVAADDGYAGFCIYWNDDGSPASSLLYKDDPDHVGDAGYAWSRPATYGDSPLDDCPTWSDWTCAASGGSRKRNVLFIERDGAEVAQVEAREINVIEARAAKKTTSAKKPASTSSKAGAKSTTKASTASGAGKTSSASKSNGKHTLKSLFDLDDAPKRGGKYVAWSKAQNLIA